jgi:5-methylcytosine-specific restriction endonuclease McrA
VKRFTLVSGPMTYVNQTAILTWLKSIGHHVSFVRDYAEGPRPEPPPRHRRISKPDPARPNGTSELVEYLGTPCPYCGDVMTSEGQRRKRPTRDHKHPKSKGGTLGRRNKIIVCRDCNEDKSSRTLEAWHAVLIAHGDLRAEKVGWILFDEIKGRGDIKTAAPISIAPTKG